MLRTAEQMKRNFNYPVRCKGKIFNCWIASTPSALQTGLMQYQLSPGQGCLLVFPPNENLGLWMKNCLHPLVALFLSENGTIIGKAEMSNADPNVIHRGPEGTRMALEILPEEAGGLEIGDILEGQE